MKSKTFQVSSDKDVVQVREFAREIAAELGFSTNDRTLITTVVSEICRNILEYAQKGNMSIKPIHKNPGKGICITAKDNGPGIADLKMAMQDGYSTGRGMGVGLPGSKRIMDDFNIESIPGSGTKITMCKWL
ncbi:MAG: anti-sigma regulatory factor [Balneolaceae bacterium]